MRDDISFRLFIMTLLLMTIVAILSIIYVNVIEINEKLSEPTKIENTK